MLFKRRDMLTLCLKSFLYSAQEIVTTSVLLVPQSPAFFMGLLYHIGEKNAG